MHICKKSYFISWSQVVWVRADTHSWLDRQDWISTLLFELNIEFQHWHFCRYVDIALIRLFLLKQYWLIFSTLSKNVNVELKQQCWAQTAMLIFNIACLSAGVYQPLLARVIGISFSLEMAPKYLTTFPLIIINWKYHHICTIAYLHHTLFSF